MKCMPIRHRGCLAILITLFATITPAESPIETRHLAFKIQSRLEQNLYTLPLEQQGEYALMLYRTTGKKVYLNTALVSLFLSADRLQRLAGNMARKVDRLNFLSGEIAPPKPDLLERYTDYFFYGFHVLPELLRVSQFSMTLRGGLAEKINRGVSSVDIREALTSRKMQEHYAPDMAQHVYALLNLDFGDYRKVFIESFRTFYPDKQDDKLTTEQKKHKWLTMSHLVLAASDQLQEPVNDPALSWIPDYLQAKESDILAIGNDILLAKIGLALLLTGNKQSPLLEKIRRHLANRPRPNTVGKSDFWSMMLLGWVDHYYPDPALYQMRRFKHRLPYILKPTD